uniref:Alpha 1,4-glycosyltransferase domain-containing protein n=1 Tax=Chaetoceros debilis TaxID=122233 RepID=A0A7S3QJD5_9STRA
MRSLSLQKRLAIIFAVGLALSILGMDFLVTEETTRGLQEEQETNDDIDTTAPEAVEAADNAEKVGKTDVMNVSNDLEVHENKIVFVDGSEEDRKKPIMHTFYEAIPSGCCGMTKEGHENLVDAWKRSWEDRGWETVILTEEDARKHPDFDMLEKKLLRLRVNAYNRRCYWRWLAMASAGGGWMSDYDVFPLTLNSELGLELEKDDTFKTYALHVPCLIHASAKEWNRILDLMIDLLPERNRGQNISDMYSLLNLDIEKGRSGMKWAHDVSPRIIYKRNKEGHQWINCEDGWRYLAVHLSHQECALSIKEDRYPEIDSFPSNGRAAVERRSEAGLRLMSDYKDKCMDNDSSQ